MSMHRQIAQMMRAPGGGESGYSWANVWHMPTNSSQVIPDQVSSNDLALSANAFTESTVDGYNSIRQDTSTSTPLIILDPLSGLSIDTESGGGDFEIIVAMYSGTSNYPTVLTHNGTYTGDPISSNLRIAGAKQFYLYRELAPGYNDALLVPTMLANERFMIGFAREGSNERVWVQNADGLYSTPAPGSCTKKASLPDTLWFLGEVPERAGIYWAGVLETPLSDSQIGDVWSEWTTSGDVDWYPTN